MKTKILIVDDDTEVQATLRGHLEREAYSVTSVHCASELAEILKQPEMDLVLLDLGLPDCDGLVLINRIRAVRDVPVIVVTGRGGMVDTVVGLEMGADDYISKPFRLRELSARIRAVLRRAGHDAVALNTASGAARSQPQPQPQPQPLQLAGTAHQADRIRFGDWVMDCAAMEVVDDDNNSAGLTTREFELLEAFVRAPHCVLSRDRLFELVRSDDYESFNRAIDIQITRIRKKLNDNAKAPDYIKTVRGAGYMMICDTYRMRG